MSYQTYELKSADMCVIKKNDFQLFFFVLLRSYVNSKGKLGESIRGKLRKSMGGNISSILSFSLKSFLDELIDPELKSMVYDIYTNFYKYEGSDYRLYSISILLTSCFERDMNCNLFLFKFSDKPNKTLILFKDENKSIKELTFRSISKAYLLNKPCHISEKKLGYEKLISLGLIHYGKKYIDRLTILTMDDFLANIRESFLTKEEILNKKDYYKNSNNQILKILKI